MSDLSPVAFDIETSGLDSNAVVTVAGFGHELGCWLVLNADGREAVPGSLEPALEDCVPGAVELRVRADERGLLEAVRAFASERIDGDAHYLTAYNGERWNGGFDLPFLRSACLRNGVRWPFGDLAYADAMDLVERFDTNDEAGLVAVYDHLVGEDSCDPFADSGAAVAAFEEGEWLALLRHNLADVRRTRQLAVLAGRFVPKSDFGMKNLDPPGR